MEIEQHSKPKRAPYLSAAGAWALAFGCAVGWGSFVMPGGTFLPIAGPVGTAVGLGLGALIMLIIAANYHFLMNRYPEAGGTYAYTKHIFGYDRGFLSAWFLIITYVTIIWANATALPLIARTLLGSTFQFGFHYSIAGFDIYFGEILLAIFALVLGAILCLRRKVAERTQIVMAILLFAGVVICFAAAMGTTSVAQPFTPPFSEASGGLEGTFTIFALAPWAYVGFESITHSAAEAKYPLKRSFRVMAVALVCSGIAYALLALLAVTALPEGCASWTEYIAKLGSFEGPASQPTFFAAYTALGTLGSVILGIAALCAIFTGLIGNYVALSRLLSALAEDGMFYGWIGKTDKNQVPRNAILLILGVSVIMPFFGRTAISWIVDVTTVGATIAYAFAAAAALKAARQEKNKLHTAAGIAGFIVSMLFAVAFLIPNLLSVKTLATESYLILAIWGILGFIMFRLLLRKDKEKRLGRSTLSWIVLLGLVIFTSSVWMRQATERSIERAVAPIQNYYVERLEEAGVDVVSTATKPMYEYVWEQLQSIETTMTVTTAIQIGFIVLALLVMFDIYNHTQRRERQTEIEKALAEDASRAKTSFLSNMSHEIRTPLNAIIGLDSMALRSENLEPRTREQLEKIGASAKHLLGLINDILDMSRIESGRMVLKNEEFRLGDMIGQVNIMVQSQCLEKGLQYTCKIDENVGNVYFGDDMKLKQVLINILGNSVKFTEPPGEVSLHVSRIPSSASEDVLRFQMRDTGIGMDEKYISKIFEAFSQEDMTSTNRYGGSGLGMAITKNFVEMMQGKIEVKSQKGVGSVFIVTVPLKRALRPKTEKERSVLGGNAKAEPLGTAGADALAGGRPAAAIGTLPGEQAEPGGAAETAKTDAAKLAGKRLLLAEDVALNAEILTDLLELEDIRSETAENGQIALEMFSEKPAGYYDAILMDMRMPVMDGLAATRAIRALNREDAKTIPIIAMTANVFEEDIEQCLAAGMNAHLGKPIEPETLFTVLNRSLSAYRAF